MVDFLFFPVSLPHSFTLGFLHLPKKLLAFKSFSWGLLLEEPKKKTEADDYAE